LRLLHTSDWHLGKTVHGQSLERDQEHAVASIEKELEKGYRCLIVAGDVFDRAIPPTTALEVLSGFLERVSSRGIEVVIIPGNHDSPERLDFASGLLRPSGVHIRCRYEDCAVPIVIEDGREKVKSSHCLTRHREAPHDLPRIVYVPVPTASATLLNPSRSSRRHRPRLIRITRSGPS